MNENINLCEILKGHEGETFWSDVFDLVTLIEVKEDFIIISWGIIKINLYKDGSRIKNERCVLFPSKDQRDWNKWIEEQKSKVPKTWEECYKILGKGEFISNTCNISENELILPSPTVRNILPIGLAKPMLALCKLLGCREVYRQGWKPDWRNSNQEKYCIRYQEGNNLYEDRVMSFQSAKVRSAFLENFSDLIEEAKELI